MMLFTWMDKTVYEASSGKHLSLERFPRMADYDHAKALVTLCYPVSSTLLSRYICDNQDLIIVCRPIPEEGQAYFSGPISNIWYVQN